VSSLVVECLPSFTPPPLPPFMPPFRVYVMFGLAADASLGRYLVPLAVNRFGFDKAFFLDLRTGDLRCLEPTPAGRPAFVLAHPPASELAGSEGAAPAPRGALQGGAGAVRWLEALAGRVADGTYGAAPLRPDDPPGTLGLCLFPRRQPAPRERGPGGNGGGGGGAERRAVCTVAVTRGVECRASVVFMAEAQQWTYSVSVRLLGPGDGPGYVSASDRGFATCQLQGRHWKVEGPAGSNEEVGGEGVRLRGALMVFFKVVVGFEVYEGEVWGRGCLALQALHGRVTPWRPHPLCSWGGEGAVTGAEERVALISPVILEGLCSGFLFAFKLCALRLLCVCARAPSVLVSLV
jgi:hypothetical protein